MLIIFMLLMGFVHESKANDITVVDVRRNITLADGDKVYKDFYINAGTAAGFKKNLVVTAARKLNVRDASGANAVGEIVVPVGQLKVIAVFDRITVAREYTLLSREELPMLEQVGIMTGDRIELKGSFVDNKKPKVKPTSAVAPAQPQQPTPTTATPPAVVSAPAGEKLEKMADSGNNSVHD